MWLLFPDCPTLSRELDHKERIWDMNQQPYGLMAPWRGHSSTEPQLWNFKQCFNRLEMNFQVLTCIPTKEGTTCGQQSLNMPIKPYPNPGLQRLATEKSVNSLRSRTLLDSLVGPAEGSGDLTACAPPPRAGGHGNGRVKPPVRWGQEEGDNFLMVLSPAAAGAHGMTCSKGPTAERWEEGQRES